MTNSTIWIAGHAIPMVLLADGETYPSLPRTSLPAASFIPMATSVQDKDDQKECAFIRLRGTTERLHLILEHRSERNYAVAFAAVERALAEYRTFP